MFYYLCHLVYTCLICRQELSRLLQERTEELDALKKNMLDRNKELDDLSKQMVSRNDSIDSVTQSLR